MTQRGKAGRTKTFRPLSFTRSCLTFDELVAQRPTDIMAKALRENRCNGSESQVGQRPTRPGHDAKARGLGQHVDKGHSPDAAAGAKARLRVRHPGAKATRDGGRVHRPAHLARQRPAKPLGACKGQPKGLGACKGQPRAGGVSDAKAQRHPRHRRRLSGRAKATREQSACVENPRCCSSCRGASR